MIQLTALEDWSVSETQQWDSAIKFMENTLQDELDKGIRKIKEMLSLENQPHISSDVSPATFSTLHDSTSSFSRFHIQCAHWLTIHFSVWMIHLIPKWRQINYSFVCMLISPFCLIFTSKFFCVLYMLTRHRKHV